MKKFLSIILISLFTAMFIAACGGGAADSGDTIDVSAIGDAANGEVLFAELAIGDNNAPGCITCHSLESNVTLVGPSQSDIGLRAETRVDGLSAEEYIRQSIVDPEAYLVEGFASGLMYADYASDLTEDQINDIVAYMLTLR
jgi:cytochrome c551/c552